MRIDALVNLLADAVAERLVGRSTNVDAGAALQPPLRSPEPATSPTETPRDSASESAEESSTGPIAVDVPDVADSGSPPEAAAGTEPVNEQEPVPAPRHLPAFSATGSPRPAVLIGRLAIGLLAVVILINIPLGTRGIAFARSIPNTASLVIRNGLVVKETNSPQIWVYRDGAFHWITTLDAFQYFGYRWSDVRMVEPGFLNQFAKGRPLYVLLKCDASPNIYQLDAGKKHWIVDIATFVAQGYVWQDVKMVPCSDLSNLPNGDSIPPGRGSPPLP